MKETYYVKLPKHIVFGDPWYFEEYSGEKLDSLVVDMNPPSHFQARVVLEAVQDEKYPDAMLHTLCLYMAPEQTIQTYMQDMFYESQTYTVKEIGVDTAQYYLCVDNSDDTIHTGGDGYWGSYHEITRNVRGKTILDAAILMIALPEDMAMEDMREFLHYFFEDAQQIENVPEPDEELTAGQDTGQGAIITQ